MKDMNEYFVCALTKEECLHFFMSEQLYDSIIKELRKKKIDKLIDKIYKKSKSYR